MDPVQNLSKKVSMDLVHDRGPWNRSKVGVHVLSFGSKAITGSSFQI